MNNLKKLLDWEEKSFADGSGSFIEGILSGSAKSVRTGKVLHRFINEDGSFVQTKDSVYKLL